MSQGRRPLVAGNWKMNGLKASAAELTKVIQGAAGRSANVDLLVCPPATLVMAFAVQAHGSRVAVGGQDCHAEPSGAFTGDVAAEMLADAGATAVIVGHSERRAFHRENDAQVAAKARSQHAYVCTRRCRDAGCKRRRGSRRIACRMSGATGCSRRMGGEGTAACSAVRLSHFGGRPFG